MFWVIFSFGLVMAVGIAAGGLYLSLEQRTNDSQAQNQRAAAPLSELPQLDDEDNDESIADMIERVIPTVVGISTVVSSESPYAGGYMGSGVIATDNGFIVTNQHVIGDKPEKITVTLYNGSTKTAKEVWSDAGLDLAVIKIDGTNFPRAEFGSAEKLRVGESVIAIGNPLSMQFERTVTAGIVSALNRTITVDNSGISGMMEDLIQTDASINPGNSGGPLINSAGEVVGVNTIKVTDAEGMGFAIPIDLCRPVIERIQRMGSFETPYLGLYAYTCEAARYMKKVAGFSRGLYVSQLDSAGPAFLAGLRYGDIVMYVDGVEVNSMLALRRQIFTHQPGDAVSISFLRDDTLREVAVTLGKH